MVRRLQKRDKKISVMTKDQKNEAIEVLKEKFNQYNNFYITNTESLSVAQVNKLAPDLF